MTQQNLAHHMSADQSGMFANDTIDGSPYQNPFEYGDSSHWYLTEGMDTDQSLTSQDLMRSSASISSYVYGVFDEEPFPDTNCSSSSVESLSHQLIDLTAGCDLSSKGGEQRPGLTSQLRVNPDKVRTAALEDDKSLRLREPTAKTRRYMPVNKQTKQTKELRAREAHLLVERKYRENLNIQFRDLYCVLEKAQTARAGTEVLYLNGFPSNLHDEFKNEDIRGVAYTSSKIRKSDVLSEALKYIQITLLEMRSKNEKLQELNERIRTMGSWLPHS